jgi:hypothetical protein
VRHLPVELFVAQPDFGPDIHEVAYLGIQTSGMHVMRVKSGVTVDPVAGVKNTICLCLRESAEQIIKHVQSLILAKL